SEEVAVATALREIELDLVISDLHLGSGDGTRLADRLREAKPDLPIIFITGSAETDLPDGEVAFRKPISEPVLARAVLECLGRWPASLLPRKALRETDDVRRKTTKPAALSVIDGWLAIARVKGRLPAASDMDTAQLAANEHAYLLHIAGENETASFRFV